MKYLIKFWDKKEMIVSEGAGLQIMNAKEKGGSTIRFNGALYETKAISYIEPIREKQKDFLLPEKTEKPVSKETLERLKKEIAERFNWNKETPFADEKDAVNTDY